MKSGNGAIGYCRKLPQIENYPSAGYIFDFVNKTSRDKGVACANEKQKLCNRIPSDNILGRNDPTADINDTNKYHRTLYSDQNFKMKIVLQM